MSSGTKQATELDAPLAELRRLGVDTTSLEGPLRNALREGELEPLLAWAREWGASRAASDSEIAEVVEAAMAVGKALQAARPDLPDGEGLSAALVARSVEGYVAAHKAASGEDESPEHLTRRLSELTALHRIISAANSSLKLHDMLNETVQAVVDVTGADICSIFLYDQDWDQLTLTATSGLSQDAVGEVRLQVGEGLTGWAATVGKPIAVKNAWSDPRFKYIPALQEDRAVAFLAVPVVLFTKEKLVGVITMQNFKESEFAANEIKFLETVAGEIAIAIENARLYEQTDARLQQKVAELSTLQGVSAHIAATLNLPEVLTLIAYQAAHLVHADAAAIYELHPDAGVLELVAQYDLQDPRHSIHQGKAGPHVIMDVNDSEIANTISRGIPLPMSPQADADLGIPFAGEGYLSMFCVPLVAPRAIMGGICLYNLDLTTFSDEQVRLLDAFGHEAAIALENSRLYDAALRGLRTKSALLQEMNHRVRNNLQTVAGLLSMQLRRMEPTSEAATAVRESIARVQSIAAVHDLMVSGDVESIGVGELARRVAEAAISTLSKPDLKVKLTIASGDADAIRVGSHEATLLALLINELVSNTILHGFAGRSRGEITIRARMGHDKQIAPGEEFARGHSVITIEIEDNGAGLPDGFDPREDANLGLNIVHTLVAADLRGRFIIESGKGGKGAVARIAFMPSRPA